MRPRAVLAGLIVLAAGVLVAVRRRIATRAAQAPLPPPPPPALPPAPRFVSVAWELLEAAEHGERGELTIRFERAERMALDRVDVLETATQVFVTVIARCEPPDAGPLADDVQETATVALRAPLGERELVHGAVDPR